MGQKQEGKQGVEAAEDAAMDADGQQRAEEIEAKADSSDVFYSMHEGIEGNEAAAGQSPTQTKNQMIKDSDSQDYPEHVK